MSSFLLNGFPRRALTPTTAPAELAALLPIPLPAFMPFSISISKPKGVSICSSKASTATPATFFWFLVEVLVLRFL